MHVLSWVVLTFFLSPTRRTDASRVVVYQFTLPVPNSHFMLLNRLTEELAARGHTVMVIAPEDTVAAVTKSENVVVETYPAQHGPDILDNAKAFAWAKFVDKHLGPSLLLTMFLGHLLAECEGVADNSTMLQRVKEFHADVLVHDALVLCPKILAVKAKIPVVSVQASFLVETWVNSWNPGSFWRFHLPNPLAYHPQMRLGAHHPLTFIQRVRNSFLYFTNQLIFTYGIDRKAIAIMRQQGIDLSIPGAYGRDAMMLVNANFAVEQPRPLPPNVQMVGPIMVAPPDPLPPDLQAFMEESDNGVVVAAAGTVMPLDPPQLLEMGRAFSRLPVRVLWKLSKKDIPDQAALEALGLADNVKVVTWLPQNDVLAHNKTRAFVSHCGVNSFYEGLWHGVPIVGLPAMADQPDNAGKLTRHGAGIALPNLFDVTEAQLFDAVLRILNEPSFRQNAQKLSKRMRSRKRLGPEEAADWIEHVADTGGEPYLRPPIDDLSFIARHSLDVIAFWTACAGIPTWLLFRTVFRRRPLRASGIKGAKKD